MVNSLTPDDYVDDDEIVYRSIRLEPRNFRVGADGEVFVSANAFNDRMKQPSFFRHRLTDKPPYSNPPRMNDTDALVALVAGAIRQTFTFMSGQGSLKSETAYIIDIRPDVSGGQHKSHAVVFSNPEYKTNGAFDRLKERLAILSSETDWAIPPAEAFVQEQLARK